MVRGLVARKTALAAVTAALAAACAGEPGAERALTVFAASSLREAFSELGEALERASPGATVRFDFAGSQELRARVELGAPVDVIATADRAHMTALERAGLVDAHAVFAHNGLVIVLGPDAPQSVRTVDDLPRAARIVLAASEVPLGRYTDEVLARAGGDLRARVASRVVSRELNARQVLAKVRLGEADAAIVYRSDARTASGLRVIELPVHLDPRVEYPIAVVRATRARPLAEAFVALTRSETGEAALERAGFGRVERAP